MRIIRPLCVGVRSFGPYVRCMATQPGGGKRRSGGSNESEGSQNTEDDSFFKRHKDWFTLAETGARWMLIGLAMYRLNKGGALIEGDEVHHHYYYNGKEVPPGQVKDEWEQEGRH